MQCELSGKQVDKLIKVRIEGTVMNVAPEYASYGEVLQETFQKPKPVAKKKAPVSLIQKDFEFVDVHFGELIRKKRESMGLRQKDFARFINERESLIHQLESGHLKPSQQIMNKLKQKVGLDLQREVQVQEFETSEEEKPRLTLGDFMKKSI